MRGVLELVGPFLEHGVLLLGGHRLHAVGEHRRLERLIRLPAELADPLVDVGEQRSLALFLLIDAAAVVFSERKLFLGPGRPRLG